MTELQTAPVGLNSSSDKFPTAADDLRVTSLLEQANHLLTSWYDVDATAAAALLLVWSAQYQVEPATIADVLVHEIGQGREPRTHPRLARRLETRLRQLP